MDNGLLTMDNGSNDLWADNANRPRQDNMLNMLLINFIINYQFSTINYQLSIINYQLLKCHTNVTSALVGPIQARVSSDSQ